MLRVQQLTIIENELKLQIRDNDSDRSITFGEHEAKDEDLDSRRNFVHAARLRMEMAEARFEEALKAFEEARKEKAAAEVAADYEIKNNEAVLIDGLIRNHIHNKA